MSGRTVSAGGGRLRGGRAIAVGAAALLAIAATNSGGDGMTAAAQSTRSATTSERVLQACITRQHGTINLISADLRCPPGQQRLRWNARGPAGPRGSTGARGLRGERGPGGPTGQIGARGEIGPSGSAGPSGPSGPDGTTGATGPGGSSGPSGPTGPTGPTGPAAQSNPQVHIASTPVRLRVRADGSSDPIYLPLMGAARPEAPGASPTDSSNFQVLADPRSVTSMAVRAAITASTPPPPAGSATIDFHVEFVAVTAPGTEPVPVPHTDCLVDVTWSTNPAWTALSCHNLTGQIPAGSAIAIRVQLEPRVPPGIDVDVEGVVQTAVTLR